MDERWSDRTAIRLERSKKTWDHFVKEGVFHVAYLFAITQDCLLEPDDLLHCFAKPGLPGRFPLGGGGDVAKVCRNLEAEFAGWGFASCRTLELSDERDEGLHVGHFVFKFVEGAKIEPSIRVRRIVRPRQRLRNAGRNRLMDD